MLFPKRLKLFCPLLLCHVLIHIAKYLMSQPSMSIQITPNQVPNHRFRAILRRDCCETFYHPHHWRGNSKGHHGHYVDLVTVLFLQELTVNVEHAFGCWVGAQ